MSSRTWFRIGNAVVAAALFAACATSPPLSVRPADPRQVRQRQQDNALSSGGPSQPTRIVLRRLDLLAVFAREPEAAIQELHELAATGDPASSDLLFALAELSFLLARRQLQLSRDPSRRQSSPGLRRRRDTRTPVGRDSLRASSRAYALAAAVYAWAFLFDGKERDEISPLDPRARLAADLYNAALAAALTGEGGAVELRSGGFALPFGTLTVDFDPASLVWGARRLTELLPATRFEVRGLRNRYRQPGIGAPLVARTELVDPARRPARLSLDELWVGATALLRLDRPREQLQGASLRGRLTLYRGREESTLELGGRRVPLEIEPSAALAATLEASGVWQGQLSAFLGRALSVDRPPQLFSLEPHVPGKVPVVFVHGTNSNPAWWGNMANDLRADPRIRERFAFWFFAYDSGNPILYSGMNLRRALREAVALLGEAGPCLEEMIVVGHSQGGLLTKLTAVDSGTRFWDAIARRPFEEAELRPETRELLREALFVEPLPFVERVVFIATPHRGSFLASPGIVRRVASRLIQLPADLVEVGTDLAGLAESASAELRFARMATSLDNMSPGNVFIQNLAELPVAPGVAVHSIVAVRGSGPPERGSDGVVRFSSAHLADADSELVVRSGHSTQLHPHTINEVLRILLLHAEGSRCDSRASQAPSGIEPRGAVGRSSGLPGRGARTRAQVGDGREAVQLSPELVAERHGVEQHPALRLRAEAQVALVRPGIGGVLRHEDAEASVRRDGGIDGGDDASEGSDGDRRPAAELHGRPALELEAELAAGLDQGGVETAHVELRSQVDLGRGERGDGLPRLHERRLVSRHEAHDRAVAGRGDEPRGLPRELHVDRVELGERLGLLGLELFDADGGTLEVAA